jgi:hypothetical protein
MLHVREATSTAFPAAGGQRFRIIRFACRFLTACAICFGTTQPSAIARDRWTELEAWSWYLDQPQLFGANYVMGYAVSPTEMWQADVSTPGANTFDLSRINFELDRAQLAGMNTLRVTLSYEVWRADNAGFMNRLEQFISASDAHDIRPTFIFCLLTRICG